MELLASKYWTLVSNVIVLSAEKPNNLHGSWINGSNVSSSNSNDNAYLNAHLLK